ncbi:hypothetical protein GCM10009802_20380 [Streptomyces synnematoformans]|uniref:Uncharacterized protein n=1 Tax=Streptomyces synnematoformans TaxID=415721 RepID=A0ABP5JPU7_9ACTN
MPTLAQTLNDESQPADTRISALSSGSTSTTIQTTDGTMVNAIGVTPTTGRVISVRIGGLRYAIGWIRS